MMRLLLPAFAAFAILLPSLATAQAADEADPALDGILKRLESRDPFTNFEARQDFEDWAILAGDKARPVLESLKGRGTERRQEAVTGALDLLDDLASSLPEKIEKAKRKAAEAEAERLEEAKRRELEAKEDAAAKGPEESRILALLRTASRPERIDRGQYKADLENWAQSASGDFRRLVKPYLHHWNPDIVVLAVHLDSLLDEADACAKFLKALDPLGMPSVAGLRREVVRRVGRPDLPESPWFDLDEATGAWTWEPERDEDSWLFDDGVARHAGTRLYKMKFGSELRAFLGERRSFDQAPAADRFWRAVIFARWACESGLGSAGVDCYRLAKGIARDTWPDEDETALGLRAARHGAQFLARAATQCTDRPLDEIDLWERVAAIPGEIRPAGCEKALERAERYKDGFRRWGSVQPADASPLSAPEQARFVLWEALTWKSDEIREGHVGDMLERVHIGDVARGGPAAWLCALRWDAVPALVEHLDDATATSTFDGEYRVQIGDLAWLALRSFAGPSLPPGVPAAEPWLLRNSDGHAVRAAMQDLWKRLEPLSEEERWAALCKDGSPTAQSWLLEHAPERCLPEAWGRLDLNTRTGQLGRRSLLKTLSLAPRAKLEALRDSTEGDLHEALVGVLEDFAPPAK